MGQKVHPVSYRLGFQTKQRLFLKSSLLTSLSDPRSLSHGSFHRNKGESKSSSEKQLETQSCLPFLYYSSNWCLPKTKYSFTVSENFLVRSTVYSFFKKTQIHIVECSLLQQTLFLHRADSQPQKALVLKVLLLRESIDLYLIQFFGMKEKGPRLRSWLKKTMSRLLPKWLQRLKQRLRGVLRSKSPFILHLHVLADCVSQTPLQKKALSRRVPQKLLPAGTVKRTQKGWRSLPHQRGVQKASQHPPGVRQQGSVEKSLVVFQQLQKNRWNWKQVLRTSAALPGGKKLPTEPCSLWFYDHDGTAPRASVSPSQNIAHFLAEVVVQLFQARVSYGRIRQRVRELATKKLTPTQGIKVQMSGRFNGAEMASTEVISFGPMPLSTLRVGLAYTQQTAHTRVGSIGVKVWVF